MFKKGLKIVLLGPQASGKGTQGKLLSETFNIIRISTGEMFRSEIAKKTKLGREIQSYISTGNLVPDDITSKVLQNRINDMDCRNGFILDGYPRDIKQAKFLDSITNIDFAIEINISNEEAQKRIENRRFCENCGRSYDLVLFPPKKDGICDKCGGKVIKRLDDYPEAIKKRLNIYREEVKPIIKFYEKKGVLIRVRGDDTIENIFEDIKGKMVKKLGSKII